jgi:hypothetical protein
VGPIGFVALEAKFARLVETHVCPERAVGMLVRMFPLLGRCSKVVKRVTAVGTFVSVMSLHLRLSEETGSNLLIFGVGTPASGLHTGLVRELEI